jgi:hypothetical protein
MFSLYVHNNVLFLILIGQTKQINYHKILLKKQ